MLLKLSRRIDAIGWLDAQASTAGGSDRHCTWFVFRGENLESPPERGSPPSQSLSASYRRVVRETLLFLPSFRSYRSASAVLRGSAVRNLSPPFLQWIGRGVDLSFTFTITGPRSSQSHMHCTVLSPLYMMVASRVWRPSIAQTRVRGNEHIQSPLPFCRRLARLPDADVLSAIWELGPGIAAAISGCAVFEFAYGLCAALESASALLTGCLHCGSIPARGRAVHPRRP